MTKPINGHYCIATATVVSNLCVRPTFRPPLVLCNTFRVFLVIFLCVSICQLGFEGVENKSWSGGISYIHICI